MPAGSNTVVFVEDPEVKIDWVVGVVYEVRNSTFEGAVAFG